ncbi:MAG: hypothetical protein R3C02_18825 [Planctomycetaceae bacterium]
MIFAHQNEAGEILSYSGRDVRFDEKWQKWINDGRPQKSKPNKHRYVKGYHRLELYGQQADRLDDRRLKEFLSRYGVVIVEGKRTSSAWTVCTFLPSVSVPTRQLTNSSPRLNVSHAPRHRAG